MVSWVYPWLVPHPHHGTLIHLTNPILTVLMQTQAPTPLEARQSSSSDSCPSTVSGGGIAGIVIGSIAGTLLLLWLWKLCKLPGARNAGDPDFGYIPGTASARGRYRRRRRSPSVVEYIEKSSRSRPRYRDEPRRPANAYLS